MYSIVLKIMYVIHTLIIEEVTGLLEDSKTSCVFLVLGIEYQSGRYLSFEPLSLATPKRTLSNPAKFRDLANIFTTIFLILRLNRSV